MGVAAAMIVIAVVQATTVSVTAGMRAKSQREAKEENRRLAGISRDDTLAAQRENRAISRLGLAQSERMSLRNLGENRRQYDLGIAERQEDRAYSRKKDVYQNALNTQAGNTVLQDRSAKYWGGK